MRRTCRKRHNALPPPAPHQPAAAPLLGKKLLPALLCRSRPNEKKRAVRPRKNGLQKSAVSHERRISGRRIHSSKNRRSEGLKMLSAEKSAKNKEKYRQKTCNGRKAPPREYSGRPYLMTKKKSRCLTGNGIHIKIELVCALFSFSFLGRCLSGRSLGCGSFSSRSSLGSRLA